jgi:hypothetical protein
MVCFQRIGDSGMKLLPIRAAHFVRRRSQGREGRKLKIGFAFLMKLLLLRQIQRGMGTKSFSHLGCGLGYQLIASAGFFKSRVDLF